MLGRDSRAIVLHLYQHLVLFRGKGHDDTATVLSVFHAILYQVGHHLVDAFHICMYKRGCRQVVDQLEFNLTLLGLAFQLIKNLQSLILNVKIGQVHLYLTGLHVREREQVVNQYLQTIKAFGRFFQKLAPHRLV